MNIESFINWIKTNKIKTLLYTILLLLGPLIIVHLLFKWNSGCDFISAEWSAGDLIAYIAGFETFIGTVVLGIIAVWQSDRANITNDNLLNLTKENERKSVLPFLSFNSYIPKYEGNSFISMLAKAMHESKSEEDEKYIPLEDTTKRVDILLDELNFTIYSNVIKINAELTQEQKEVVNNQFGISKQEGGVAITIPNHYYTKIFVENCGKGSAINVKCRIYKIGYEDNDNFDVYSIPFTVPVQKHFDLGLFIDLKPEIQGDYVLEFTYYDIYMNVYIQTIPIELGEEKCSIDYFQPQKHNVETTI